MTVPPFDPPHRPLPKDPAISAYRDVLPEGEVLAYPLDPLDRLGLPVWSADLFSADGARIVALEALVRWPHPVRGMISPADFIPIAEERGLIIPLGQWVLRTACRDGTRWPGIRESPPPRCAAGPMPPGNALWRPMSSHTTAASLRSRRCASTSPLCCRTI